ncbi:cell wall-binding repeat-containing protein [Herbiconiux liangxiaofengii]|uniref:cell wall-binding repeat-containing protein n=1 Tax=Herbiconiux liangxiaofengii TaxID=3342795 RepID=UPI0035B9A3EE
MSHRPTRPTRSARTGTRRSGLAVLAIAALLGGSLLGADAAAAVDAPAPTPGASETDAPTPGGGTAPLVMGDYSLDAYSSRAAEVPPELAQVIADDLGQTPEGYLANADAAADAVAVVDSLAASGVDVLGSRLDGTTLVVNVPDASAVATVEAANAVAEIGDPAPLDLTGQDFEFKRDLIGGQGYFSQDSQYRYLCSTAFNGLDRSSGQKQVLTAGHCKVEGTQNDSRFTEQVQSKPGSAFSVGVTLGQPVAGSFALGSGFDNGLIATDSAWTPRAAVGVWGGANNGPVTSGTPVTVRDYGDAIVGQSVCKSGRTTGWTCGTVEAVDIDLTVDGNQKVNADIIDGMCALGGDSGGAVVSGANAMGLLSAGTYNSCSDTGKFSAVYPMIGGTGPDGPYGSVLSFEKNWDMIAEVSTPAVTSPTSGATLQWGSPMSGTLPFGSSRHTVVLTVDGTRTYTAPVAQDGSWAILPTDLADGAHSYSLRARFGQGAATSTSSAVTGSFTVAGHPSVDRIAGADRFQVAVNVSRAAHPDPLPGPLPVVYVATGANYPDALSAGPAAVTQGGPLLLVTRDSVPSAVATELQRLAPQRIVVVGGPNSVSTAVEESLKTLVTGVDVSRVSGADRFAVSRDLASSVFGTAPHAYVATGTNFPDALVAGAASGSTSEPVVLVNGPTASADEATLAAFRDLDTSSITIVGGPNSVSEGVAASLGTIPASVDRVSGADRFDAAIALNRSAYTSSSTVYLATGYNFPDALAGGVLAGAKDAPLYIAPTDCVPRGVIADIVSLGATRVVLLGGEASLTPAVARLAPCAK